MDNTKVTDTYKVEVEGDAREVPQVNVDAQEKSEHLIAPDQFDERYRTTRQEIWAYYSCVYC